MNKTIIININGVVFHIEEDAYELLKSYMIEVKTHFASSPDSAEITTDIENRIAEMFTEILERDKKQAIVLADVQAVTTQMGRVSDFEQEEPGEEKQAYTAFEAEGIPRKLFRDPDDRLISGVCAGVAAYFDTQTLWIRIAFLLAFFGFGTGLFLYIILWIVMPLARTRTEKLAMRGEKPNLQNIKKNFDEEMGHLRDGVNRMSSEARPLLHKGRDFIGEFFRHLGNFLNTGGKIIIKLIAIFFLIVFLVVIIATFVSLLAVTGFWSGMDESVFPFNIVNPNYSNILYVSAFFAIIIPIIAIILFIIRLVFNARAINRSVSFTLLVAWVVALSISVYYSAKTASEFSNEARLDETLNLKPASIYIMDENTEWLNREDSVNYNLDDKPFRGRLRFDGLNNESKPNRVRIYFERSENDQASIVRTVSAKGRNYNDALARARKISFRILQRDSSITIDPYIRLNNGDLWRDQEVSLTVKLPLKSRIRLEENIRDHAETQGIDYWACENDSTLTNKPKIFTMTNIGLTCRPDTVR